MLKVGFVGSGFVAKFHMRAFANIRNAIVTAVYSPHRREDLFALASELGLPQPKYYSDLREMLSKEQLDALWILAPNFARVDVTKIVVEEILQGRATVKALAYEKPLARNLYEAKQIVELVKKAGLLHGYLENQVFMPSVVRGKEIAWRRGAAIAGRPYLARAAEEHGGPHSPWFWNPALSGGGVLLDMGCHSIEAGRYLLTKLDEKDLKPVEVYAETYTLKWTQREYVEKLKRFINVDYSKMPAEDYARTIVKYETSEGQLVVSESSNAWCFVGPGLRLTFELFGPEYYMQINTLQPELFIFFSREVKGPAGEDLVEKQAAEQGLMPAIPDEAITYGYVAEDKHMVEAFSKGISPRENLEDALLVMELLMAAYKSAEFRKPIRLPDPSLEDYKPPPYRVASAIVQQP
jgi:predicted dehydrogenase